MLRDWISNGLELYALRGGGGPRQGDSASNSQCSGNGVIWVENRDVRLGNRKYLGLVNGRNEDGVEFKK